jgi:hypothetical protein
MFVVSYQSGFDDHFRVEILGASVDEEAARHYAYNFIKTEADVSICKVARYEDVNKYLDMDTLYSYAGLNHHGYVVGVVCVSESEVISSGFEADVPEEETIPLESDETD